MIEFEPDFVIGGVHLDVGNRLARHHGELVALSPREVQIMVFLSPDRFHSRTELLHQLIRFDELRYNRPHMDTSYLLENNVTVYIGALRRKFGKAFIRNRSGLGYKIIRPEAGERPIPLLVFSP